MRQACEYDTIELVSNTSLKGLALALISRTGLRESGRTPRKTSSQKGDLVSTAMVAYTL